MKQRKKSTLGRMEPTKVALTLRSAYPVLAKSLDEYISTYNKEGSVASKDKPHLSDVAPLCAAIAKFWINIAEEEDSVGHE